MSLDNGTATTLTGLTTLTGYPGQGGQGGRTDPACSQIPLADRRRKLASHRHFHGQVCRTQNHPFSDTGRVDLGRWAGPIAGWLVRSGAMSGSVGCERCRR
jgi:hypothetical protein